ncbi:DHA2 family efflux MFS transporter permease subunit [Paenibacillus rhizoplanae]
MNPNSTAAAEAPFSLRAILPSLLAIIVGMIMVILDSTAVNVAVPNLVQYFDTDLKTVQWAITGYTLALAAVIPLAGYMTDRFGSKQVFLTTIAMFVLGSVLCSVAQTSGQLVLFRVIQGLGGGMVAPIGMAMVFRLAPVERRGSIMGMLGIPMLLAPALGPILAGYLVEYVSWHWIFLINLPIGIVGIILGLKYLPVIEKKGRAHLDIFGIMLAPIAFSMLAYGVNQGGGESWTSTGALVGLSVGGVALVLFVIVELLQKASAAGAARLSFLGLHTRDYSVLGYTGGVVRLHAVRSAVSPADPQLHAAGDRAYPASPGAGFRSRDAAGRPPV